MSVVLYMNLEGFTNIIVAILVQGRDWRTYLLVTELINLSEPSFDEIIRSLRHNGGSVGDTKEWLATVITQQSMKQQLQNRILSLSLQMGIQVHKKLESD